MASCGCSVFRVFHFPTSTSAPSLSPARPERFTVMVLEDPDSQRHPQSFLSCSLSLSLSLILTVTFSPMGWPVLPLIRLLLRQCYFFFRFWGSLPLHKVQFIILCNPTADPAIRLEIPSLVVFLKVMSRFPVLSSCSIFRSRFLRYRGRPPPRSFTAFLPCSCCLRPRFLMSVLQSEPYHNFFSNVPFLLPCSTSSMVCPLRLCPAQRVIFVSAAVTSFRSPQYPWVRIFLKTFILRHATAVFSFRGNTLVFIANCSL
jgi:hypothetical protein